LDLQTLCILDPLSCWALNFPFPEAPAATHCDNPFAGMCLVTPDTEGKVFGFAEFITAFALLALVYTASDARAKFRAAIAPFRLQSVIFYPRYMSDDNEPPPRYSRIQRYARDILLLIANPMPCNAQSYMRSRL
jgi:hypothetical protein